MRVDDTLHLSDTKIIIYKSCIVFPRSREGGQERWLFEQTLDLLKYVRRLCEGSIHR